MSWCPTCRKPVNPGDNFCAYCRSPLQAATPAPPSTAPTSWPQQTGYAAPPPSAPAQQGYPQPVPQPGYPQQGWPPQGYPQAGGYAQTPQPPPSGNVMHELAQAQQQLAYVRQQLGLAQQAVGLQQHLEQLQRQAAASNGEVGALQQKIATLRAELASVEDALDLQSFGFYQPHYGFKSSEEYAARLDQIRTHQKNMVKKDEATHCATEWRVAGSLAEGKKLVAESAKLMLRAFNGECDAAIATVRYDNITKLEQRIKKSYDEINKLGEAKQISITKPFFDLKLSELRLVHEHRELLQREKEEQKRIKEQMREEEKAQKEIEKAQKDAETDEQRRRDALEKARAELEDKQKALTDAAALNNEKAAAQHEKLAGLVAKLENELKDALDRKAKAIARAQLTKSGHVYVLSNIGSFGETVYKIGMTRRLDPQERVDELGDASVPFTFDVHAMIYTENAPELENALHREFDERRVNRVNNRKEFFRVSLDEIRHAVGKHHGIVTFVTSPEAEEYRKTRAMEESSPATARTA